ncbi:MAG: AI-2E family transporter [Bryobacteraceae bacterium]
MAVAPRSIRTLGPSGFGSVVIALAGAIALVYYGRTFLVTLATAVIIAFILEPFVGLLMRLRLPRSLASFLVCAIGVCVVYLLGLGIYAQGTGLADDLPRYGQRIGDVADQVIDRAESLEQSIVNLVVPKRFRDQGQQQQQQQKKPRRRGTPEPPAAPLAAVPGAVPEVRIRPERPPLVDFLYSHLRPLYEVLLMASFIPFLVYFMLSWREHIYRSFLQIFRGEARLMAAKSVDGIAIMVRAFVVGNFVLGLLLAAATTAVLWGFHLPYVFLVGPFSAFLSLVPYIGLPLAMIPPFMAALAIYKNLTSYVLMLSIIAVFHLIAMNLLYPKIVGPRVHLNPLAVTIALMFWSVLWGAPGLVLAIPLTAGIKAVCDNVSGLEPVGKFLGD